jgi:hypothetical protein
VLVSVLTFMLEQSFETQKLSDITVQYAQVK